MRAPLRLRLDGGCNLRLKAKMRVFFSFQASAWAKAKIMLARPGQDQGLRLKSKARVYS